MWFFRRNNLKELALGTSLLFLYMGFNNLFRV